MQAPMGLEIRTLSGIFALIALTASAATLNASAADSPAAEIARYTVFSQGDISYSNSDFEGRTAALGDVYMQDFHLDAPAVSEETPNLLAGGNIRLVRGQVRGGGIEAKGNVSLYRVSVWGPIRSGNYLAASLSTFSGEDRGPSAELKRLDEVAREISRTSERVGARKANQQPHRLDRGFRLHFVSRLPVAIFEISAQDLRRASVLAFAGSPETLYVVNVRGQDARFEGKDVTLLDGIRPKQVLFNFPEAETLKISASGSAKYGIPGALLAPKAATEFFNGRITGSLYVGDLRGNGQVNPSKFQWARLLDFLGADDSRK